MENKSPSSLASLVQFLLREEALLLCACLSPSELAALTCITRWGEQHEALWYSYFVLRWGNEHGAGSNTQVRFARSWVDDAWPAPWPLAVGFCGASTAWDHLFWFLPFIRCTLHVEKPRHVPPPPPPQTVAWQAAAHVRAEPGGDSRLRRCFVCDALEVLPLGPEAQHFRKRWTKPCPNCPRVAHRSCMERALLAADGDQGTHQCCAKAASGSRALEFSLLKCELCNREYSRSRRFPESLPELLRATRQEWRWTLKRLFIVFLFFMWLYSLADHYWGVSKEMCVVLAFTASMMSVSVSQRFHRGIQIIWNTPHRWRYFQIFGLLGLLFYMVSLREVQPSHWAAAVTEQPWLAGLHEVHSMIHASYLATSVLSSLSLLYLATSSGIIFLFWKTSLRVPTVGDPCYFTDDDSSQRTTVMDQCGLCQLGLCLDNPCM
eukprot:TRINITY_DN108014_c0_g1_i1.p1 TRINITY_DN108014_c0_g1~~TRINITY_DN108014_c0_g1_i1.p1  ORF type:complete len:434 (-),score=41.06 TRINITY_DN108014_c0_g1_i1:112-1413(-)